jgi:outer membrane protein OmpA-like peptidoglycan-associated protein
MVRKKKTEMKIKNQTIFLTMIATLLLPVAPEAGEIRQELYEFQMHITKTTTCTTFVITDSTKVNKSTAENVHLSMIPFELGSAVLSPTAAQALLIDMQNHEIDQHTPLVITGYSCELGSKQYNFMLSRQRGLAVVNFLKNQGYTVTTLRAKGEADPITTNPEELFKNRRVEVTTK